MRHSMKSMTGLSAMLLLPGIASAHEGEHGGSVASGFIHVITQPDHLAIVCLGAALIGCVSWAVRSVGKKRASVKQASVRTRD